VRVAVLCTGHPRTYKRCLNNWKKAIKDRFDVDYYFGLWTIDGTRLDNAPDLADLRNRTQWVAWGGVDLSDVNTDEVITNLSLLTESKNIKFFNPHEHDSVIRENLKLVNPIIFNNPERSQAKWMDLSTTLWHQAYIITKSYEALLKDKINDYDLVVRTRPDAAWVGLPNFDPHYNKIQTIFIDIPAYIPHDYLIYGQAQQMHYVLDVYNLLPQMNLIDIHAHYAFQWIYRNLVPAVHNDTNKMSMIRLHSYFDQYDVEFLLES
jgi:hypothetical protein